jgi:hypothetical protein
VQNESALLVLHQNEKDSGSVHIFGNDNKKSNIHTRKSQETSTLGGCLLESISESVFSLSAIENRKD